jgi:phage recombination protein Bet
MNVPAIRPARLPMPANADVDAGKWRVLVEAIFPNAKSPESVMLALDYCKARGLDVLKKPVNIVPMWSSALGRYVETVWPSINEIQVTAARTGQWAGMDEPVWGNNTTRTFQGRQKNKQGAWEDKTVEVTYPECCAVTVYRLIGAHRCAFTEPVYWLEAYGRVGGSELPNDMWAKRPRGQLHKVAKAASLRAAFPEEGDTPVAEEMEGHSVDPPEPIVDKPTPPDNWRPPAEGPTGPTGPGGPLPEREPVEDFDATTGEYGPRALDVDDGEEWRSWCHRLLDHVRAATTLADVDKWEEENADTMARVNTDAPKIHVQLKAAIGRHRVTLAGQPQKDATGEPDNVATG